MASYTKISELGTAGTLTGSELTIVVQGGTSYSANIDAFKTYIDGTGITATTVVTGEFLFTEDNELDYSGSFSDGMSAATITFTELPASTIAIYAYVALSNTASTVSFRWKRTSGGTQQLTMVGNWADVGTNSFNLPVWMPTGGNSIYVTTVQAGSALSFVIMGYKTG